MTDDLNLPAIALYIDHDGLRRAMARQRQSAPAPADLALHTAQHCKALGQVVMARAYGDWAAHQADPGAFHAHGIEPVQVLPAVAGSTLMVLAMDATEHNLSADAAEQVVLVAGDEAVSLVVMRLRARARVTVIAPAALADSSLAGAAHEVLTIETLLRQSPGVDGDFDPERYDWSRFIKLVAWLEDRLPFVGVGYLIKKAMNYENVGTTDPRIKQAMFQHAQDRGLVEVYYKENIDADADPVAACQLLRDNDEVAAVLEALELDSGPASMSESASESEPELAPD